MNDKELLRLLQADPDKGLEKLIECYGAYVSRIAHGRLYGICDERDIDEAISDIFLSFFNYGREKGFDSLDAVKPLLLVIARRRCSDILREKGRGIETVDIDAVAEIEDTQTDMNRAELIEAIKALGEPDSRIIWLKYFYGLRSKEIAKETGLKPNTIDKRAARALSKLRAMLEEDM